MTQVKKKELLQYTFKNTSHKNNSKWNTLIDAIVRPPRATYSYDSLGKPAFLSNQKIFYREDYQIQHKDTHQIYLNVFRQHNNHQHIILYLHGNTSNRLQGLRVFKYLPDQYALACFDFIGCGNNGHQDTISLGYREAEQTKTVIRFLKQLGFKIILWGKSMGAVTALLAGQAEYIVADSAFVSFQKLCKQVIKRYSPNGVPNCLLSCIFPCLFRKLRKDVQKKAQYDVKKLNIKKAIKSLDRKTVIILISGDKDQLINHKNSQKLFKQFEGQNRYLEIFEGNHNSVRSKQLIEKIMQILLKHTSNKQNKHKQDAQNPIKNSSQQKQLPYNTFDKFNKF